MPTLEKTALHIELDMIEIEEIEIFLQEGSRGMSEFAASCSTLCRWCCTPSCNCGFVSETADEDEMDEIFAD